MIEVRTAKHDKVVKTRLSSVTLLFPRPSRWDDRDSLCMVVCEALTYFRRPKIHLGFEGYCKEAWYPLMI